MPRSSHITVSPPLTIAHVSHRKLPLFMAYVSAGEPSDTPESGFTYVDLFDYLIRHPGSTFLVPVRGDSMETDGISDGDILIVDRIITPRADDIVVVGVDGDLTVKRLKRVGRRLWLVPSNREHHPREVVGEQECNIWGVVLYTIKKNH